MTREEAFNEIEKAKEEGRHAYLRNANLRCANLQDADMRNVKTNYLTMKMQLLGNKEHNHEKV